MENSLIIDVRTSSGFFSNYLIFLDNLKYCQRHNLKPIMRLGGNWYYSDGRQNLWDYFFEKINDGVPIGVSQHSNFFKLWEEKFTCHIGKVPLWEFYEDKEFIKQNRIEVNEISKLVKPSIEIQKKIDLFLKQNFENKKVLGLHIRGTDYHFNNLDLYLESVKKIIDEYDIVFIASDNFESINFFSEKFPNICFYETNIRMNKMNDGCLALYNPSNDKLKHGEDVLIEAYLLSNCHHLICINSNVAAAALYINPNMTYDLIHRSLQGG